MSQDWRRKKARFRAPSDRTLGIVVLGAVAVVAALTIMGKRQDNMSVPEGAQPHQAIRIIDGDTIELSTEKRVEPK